MKVFSALLAFVLLSSAAWLPADSLAFAPEAKSRAKKSFTESTTWKLTSLDRRVNGSPQPMAPIDARGMVTRALAVVDTYVKIEGGVPLELEREFDTVGAQADSSLDAQGELENFEIELTSPLSDAKVRFQREDKSADPEAKFADERSTGTDVLEGLREDLDLRALLGAPEVKQGDSWKIDAAKLADVLAPGGTLALATSSLPASQTLEAPDILLTTLCSLADAASGLEGEVTCTWRNTTAEGKAKLAVIDVDWESKSGGNLGPELIRRLGAASASTPREDLGLTVNWSSKGRGELVWDLARNRARSLRLKLDSEVNWVESWSQQGVTVALTVAMEAQSDFEVEIEED
jgi:hypothetical protein